MKMFDILIESAKTEFDNYSTRAIDGLVFHYIGRNSSHKFEIAKLGSGVVVYSHCQGDDETFTWKKDQELVGAYLGHY